MDLNNVCMQGKINGLEAIYHGNEESFYKGILEVERDNGRISDFIPIIISDNLLKEINLNELIQIKGQLRSKDVITDDNKLKVDLYINIKEISNISELNNNNIVELSGYIVKRPNLRNTPSGKQITDLLIACNYGKDKTAYIPCIAWGKNARYASKLKIGDYTNVQGRFQSRNYTKMIDSIPHNKVAYELSINKIN